MQLNKHKKSYLKTIEIIGLILLCLGTFSLAGVWVGLPSFFAPEIPFFSVGFVMFTVMTGSVLYFWGKYISQSAGVNNSGVWFSPTTKGGFWGWVVAVLLSAFYILLYWYPQFLKNLTELFNPVAYFISGQKADQWFLYGTLYTMAVFLMGIRGILKYRHSRYQIMRFLVIILSQLFLAYLIPLFLKAMQQPEFYFSYFWPLKPEYLFPVNVKILSSKGAIGQFMVFWSFAISLIGVPVLTYFFGKRWYCSWVCGCGGLANTLGDSYRQLSNKSLLAWKIERFSVHLILVLIVLVTMALWLNSFTEGKIFGKSSHAMARWYAFFIGAIFSGVIGVGFYPLFGTRIWCRYGCPQAAILGILQKYFSRFRITTNASQCISCGNCSTYCEMGIDVRSYAQRGKNIVRASCVGCGVCSMVCPRGVLRLENSKR